MAEAICQRHFRTFTEGCIRCREARAMNEAGARKAKERAQREAEFARLALVPKDSPSGYAVTFARAVEQEHGIGVPAAPKTVDAAQQQGKGGER